MDKKSVIKILNDSIVDLERRRGRIGIPDIEAEVINNACLAILKHGFEAGRGSKSLDEMILNVENSVNDAPNIIGLFTDAAKELFPEHYSEHHAAGHYLMIMTNLRWDGMWDYLRDYFKKNHGISIDGIKTLETTLYSTRHQRFENNFLVSESEVARTININFIDNKNEILVSIEPSLSPKKGYLVGHYGSEFQYNGTDPDYKFRVFMDDFNEIEKFILEMPNRNLTIVYLE